MFNNHIRLSFDQHQPPTCFAQSETALFYGLGVLQARYRPLQVLILHTAAQGLLSKTLLPLPDLLHLDKLVHRLHLLTHAEQSAHQLNAVCAERIDAFLAGLNTELARNPLPFELRLLQSQLPKPTRVSLLSALMLSSFLGLAESQERIESMLAELVSNKHNAELLQHMFYPFSSMIQHATQYQHYQPETMFSPLRSFGSNAWAVAPHATQENASLFAADPHLQINQVPSLFFEVRLKCSERYIIGASIPGLPGIAVGRNNNLAWSGTFSCADNIDLIKNESETIERVIHIEQRFKKKHTTTFRETQSRWMHEENGYAKQWAGTHAPHESLHAYTSLMFANTVQQANNILKTAHTLSLHWILADAQGSILHRTAGAIPKRKHAFGGLFVQEEGFDALVSPDDIDTLHGPDFVVSANEFRKTKQGQPISTLPQPYYRLKKIRSLLQQHKQHSVLSMQAIQRNVHASQAEQLLPYFSTYFDHVFKKITPQLNAWHLNMRGHSTEATLYHIMYQCARDAVLHALGGSTWVHYAHTTEISVWFTHAIDRILKHPEYVTTNMRTMMQQLLQKRLEQTLEPWERYQQVHFQPMLLSFLPRFAPHHGGVYALPGSSTTISQGNLVSMHGKTIAVGPAYRFVCSFHEHAAYTSLPGGVSDQATHPTYACYLQDHMQGQYHRIEAPVE